MSILVTCPECASAYRVGAESAGKAIKCKKCGMRVAVAADPPAQAVRNGDANDADAGVRERDSKRTKKGGAGKVVAIIAGSLVAACCLCSGGAGTLGYILVSRAIGTTILEKSETLTAQDPVVNRKPARSYKIALEAGKEYIIDMRAVNPGFSDDPYLILRDPQDKEVARDDDSGGRLDAQIRYTPSTAGEYTILATCLGGVPPSGMPFRLTVRRR